MIKVHFVFCPFQDFIIATLEKELMALKLKESEHEARTVQQELVLQSQNKRSLYKEEKGTSNLQIGNGSVLNRGAEITATNFEYGNIQINNGDVKYGAKKHFYGFYRL